MGLHRIFRVALHLLLIAGLVLPGIAAPAQAVTQMLAEASAAPDGKAMSHSPCAGMTMPTAGDSDAHGQMPAGHGCDLSACLGAGCLPNLPHVAALVPDADTLIAWDQPVLPSRLFDTPLRPPIS